MAGVGKSALAIHAAHRLSNRYPHQFYLNLHTHDPIEQPADAASGLGILLRTLGVPPERIPVTVEERATLWRTQLADRRALIVLDDVSDPEQIRPLLPGAADCVVLITCRRRMIELPGIFWLPLDVLLPGEAISLFTQVVGTERASDAAEVTQVVRLCSYLPLAIHLAGSKFRSHPAWSISDLAARLTRSQHSVDEMRVDEREVAASLDLSYRYLTRGQQRLLRQLALHPGAEFSVYLAAAASGDESLTATEQALDALLDHHLLEEPELGRFTFHDLIREYAWRRANLDDQEPERHHTIHRILDYYLCLAGRAASIVYPFHRRLDVKLTYVPAVLPPLSTRLESRRWVEAEWDNIISMVQYAARSNGWKQHIGLLPHVMAQFLDNWGFWSDAAALHRLAARTWHEIGDARGEARALTDLCIVLVRAGLYAEALGCAQNALEICRGQGDRAGEADALDRMGLLLWQSSRFQEALSCHEKALAIWKSIHDRHGEADALGHVGMSLTHISQYKAALKCLTRALSIYKEIGDLRGEASSLNNIADAQLHLGFYEEALERYRRALTMSRDIGDRQGEAILFNNIGNVYHGTGRHEESLSYYRRALGIYRDIGDSRCEADTLNNIGAAFQRLGHYGEALIHHQKALVLANHLAEPYQQARSLCNMGNAHRGNQEYAPAAEDYQAALELSLQIGDPYQEGLAEEGLGSVLLHTGGPAAARERWQKALNLFERIGVPEAESVRDLLRTSGAGVS